MEDKMFKAIARELRVLRAEANYSQEELASKTKVSKYSIMRYEQVITDMKLNSLAKIIEPYGIDLYIFFRRIIAKMQKERLDDWED